MGCELYNGPLNNNSASCHETKSRDLSALVKVDSYHAIGMF